MTNKTTRKALLFSSLSLLLCFAMLLGTTFAWFTDSVTSSGNIITAGNLDVAMYYADGTEAVPVDSGWTDASAGAIFDYDNWEPGYVDVKHIQIANEGTLALKYQVAIVATGEVSALADVIDVYYADPAAQVANRTDLSDANKIGTLAEVLAGMATTAYGELPAGKNHTITLAMKMQEEAGNEYQGLSIGSSFRVVLNATQLAAEEDSFGPDYDLNATYPWNGEVGELPDAVDNVVTISSAAELAAFADSVNSGESFAGKTVKLAADINLGNEEWTPIGDADADDFVGFKGTFDGQNFTISNLKVNSNSWGKGLFGYMDAETNATVKNVNIHNANIVASDCAGIIVGYATNGTFENIHVDGDVSVVATVSDGYAGGIAGCGYNANFNNCSVIANNGSKITSAGSFAGGIVGYQCNNKKAITDCKVANLTITGYAAVGGISGIIQTGSDFSFTNNSVENVVLNKTRADGNPSIGAFVGTYSGTAATTLTGKVSNVTLNGTHVEYSAYNELYGSNYSGATTPSFDITGVTASGIINNLNK